MARLRAIFHAHNWSFQRILEQLDHLKETGYDAIQVSPAQKSPAGDAWYLRYQPFDHLEIAGLGSQDDLARLCDAADRRGLRIIADVVFNHMAVPHGVRRDHWFAADVLRRQGNQGPIDKLYAKLSWFPHLSLDDFQPWRDMQGSDWDNEFRYESWGNGEWPELRPSENVISLHNQHLAKLYECGIRGFRFDAVKHMRPSHLAEYVRTISSFPEVCWSYGEVFSECPKMHEEYRHLFPTTDFPYIRYLKAALAGALPITLDPDAAFLSPASIRFGNNHDTACNPKHLVAGLLFKRPEHTRLANGLALVLAGGTALVFADDHVHDSLLRRLVAFRRDTGGLAGIATIERPSPNIWQVTTPQGSVTLDLNS